MPEWGSLNRRAWGRGRGGGRPCGPVAGFRGAGRPARHPSLLPHLAPPRFRRQRAVNDARLQPGRGRDGGPGGIYAGPRKRDDRVARTHVGEAGRQPRAVDRERAKPFVTDHLERVARVGGERGHEGDGRRVAAHVHHVGRHPVQRPRPRPPPRPIPDHLHLVQDGDRDPGPRVGHLHGARDVPRAWHAPRLLPRDQGTMHPARVHLVVHLHGEQAQRPRVHAGRRGRERGERGVRFAGIGRPRVVHDPPLERARGGVPGVGGAHVDGGHEVAGGVEGGRGGVGPRARGRAAPPPPSPLSHR
jgi:hypothetical protein